VAIPATAYDAKGLLLESIFGESPTIIIEGRALYSMTDLVPEEPYRIRFGRAVVRRKGSDITIVALGMMVPLALRAAAILEGEGIDAEVVDPRTISPLDRKSICDSVSKTRRLLVADPAWRSFGTSAEIIASVTEATGNSLVAKPVRVNLPDSHTPMSAALERKYYPDEITIANSVRSMMSGKELVVENR